MKKKAAFLWLNMFLGMIVTKSQTVRPEIVWQKCYGGFESDIPVGIVKSSDGGFLLGGYTASNNGDVSGGNNPRPLNNDIWLIKVDDAGNKIWQKCIGGQFDDRLVSIIPATDGGYIGFGTIGSRLDDPYSSKPYDIYVFKVDENGNLIWSKSYGGSGEENAGSIKSCADGSYIFTGTLRSVEVAGFNLGEDLWVVKIDNTGNTLWTKVIRNKFYQNGYEIIELTDGNLSVIGDYDPVSW